MTPRSSPRLFTTSRELAIIRHRLDEHPWYARCFANLQAPVDELLGHGITIPREKGYVFYEACPVDNTPLRQDPFEPRDHSCPTCGRNYTEEPYYRAWVTFYQSYLSQRAVDMGIAYQITGDPAYAAAIRHILKEYARNYEGYPLEDCVLGPTRLFQSTYMESLWLTNLAAAADLVAATIPVEEWRALRDTLFLPAVNVIVDYDEGDNNRQAMNNAAIGLVGILFEEAPLVEHALHGPHGWMHHLAASVGADGLWYEGDNYHFATLPAMANLADAASRNGMKLYQVEAGERRFKMMFDGPLQDLYPDLTFPARKDSRFSSSIGQRWYVGLYELAYRQYGDTVYARLLRRLYDQPPPEQDCVANAAGMIDVMRGCPANRERLDWRGFLNAVPNLGDAAGIPVTTSVNMTGTGLGILRQERGQTYASIDYGRYGGGHGHPDRLQLNFYGRGHPWLVDWGTGNYYFDHLRWYRSTLGHNTVGVDGQTQSPVDGRLLRFAETAGQQMAAAEAVDAFPGTRLWRVAVLLSPDLLLDLFGVEADRPHQLDWVIHPYADADIQLSGLNGEAVPVELRGEHYEWLEEVQSVPGPGDWTALFRQDEDRFAVHMVGVAGTEIITARAYGPPQQIPRTFPVLMARRLTERTVFAALHEHRAGGAPLIASFRSPKDGVFEIQLADGGSYRCQYDATSVALSVIRRRPDGSVVEASGFGVSELPGILSADVPLDQSFITVEGDTACLCVPEHFTRIRVLVPGVKKVAVNGMEAVASDLVQQSPAVWSSLSTGRVWIGVPNTVVLVVHNDQDRPLAGELTLSLPEGWEFAQRTPSVTLAPRATATYGLQFIPGQAEGHLAVGLTGDMFPLTPEAPIMVDAWFPNLAGATLRVCITNRSGEPRTVAIVAGRRERLIELEQVMTIDFPIEWEEGTPWTVEARCGEYLTTCDLNPLIAFLGQEYHLDAPHQVRRGERSWRGRNDLSGRFQVEQHGEVLVVRISVIDDIVWSRGPVEKPFDLDSVQVYFDPRPDEDRAKVGLAGVYGLVLIPASVDDEPAQIVPIGAIQSLDGVSLHSALRPDGYDLVLTVPLVWLDCDPHPGDKVGFDLIVNDNDGTFRRSLQMIWSGAGATRTWLQQDCHPPRQYGVLVF